MKKIKLVKASVLRTPLKKTRKKHGELTRCFKCPLEHPGWPRSALRNRRRMPLCATHQAEYDKINAPWPRCPKCGQKDPFGTMKWGGDELSTTVTCDDCGFSDKAHKYFDKLRIKIIAAPINLGPYAR